MHIMERPRSAVLDRGERLFFKTVACSWALNACSGFGGSFFVALVYYVEEKLLKEIEILNLFDFQRFNACYVQKKGIIVNNIR